MGTAVRWLLVLVAVALGAAAGAVIMGQSSSGAQPWDPELSDNFIFFKALPFVIGLGVALGIFRARGRPVDRRSDGKIQRFNGGTILGHWTLAIGFLLALPTGLWQYLGGILDVHLPIPLYVVYRIHYIGAALILFSVANFVAYWSINGDRALWVPRGQWRRHLTGFAQELPRSVGGRLAGLLRLDLSQRPRPGRFTFYETAFSFPTWTIALVLITVTGIVKAMRYIYPIPGEVLFIASTLHVAAMGLLLVKVLDHLRYTLARWPLMVAMVRGWVSESALRRVLDQTSQPAEAATETPVPPRAPAGVLGRSER